MIGKGGMMLAFWLLSLALLIADVLPCASPAATLDASSAIRLNGVLLEEKYRLGKFFAATSPKAKANDAVFLLAEVALENPVYKDTLTLLAGAYYWRGNYNEANKLLSRALAVNKEDEIAWLLYGLTQLKLDEDRKGIDSLKGGLALLNKRSEPGYLGLPNWDAKGLVRRDLRRAVLAVARADPSQKGEMINSVENLILRVNEEASQYYRSKWISYERPQYGFNITLPPDWLPIEKPENAGAAQTIFKELNPGMADSLTWGAARAGRAVFSAVNWPPGQGSFEMVGIETLDLPSEANLNDISAVFAARLEAMSFVEKPMSQRVTLDVGEAGRFLYRLSINTPAGEATWVINTYLIVKDRTLYQLVHASTLDRAEQSRPIFEEIARSFRWLK